MIDIICVGTVQIGKAHLCYMSNPCFWIFILVAQLPCAILFVCVFYFSGKEIAISNFAVHELRCERFLVNCPKCGESVPKDLLDKHDDDEHKLVQCDLCDLEMEESLLEEHKVGRKW